MPSCFAAPARSRLKLILLYGVTLAMCIGCQSDDQTLVRTALGLGEMADPDLGTQRNSLQARKLRAPSPQITYDHDESSPLAGTRWLLVSVDSKRKREAFASKTVEFTADGRLITTTTFSNGPAENTIEQYRVNGAELLVSTERFLVNASFSIADDELIVTTGDFRAALARVDR